MHEFITLLILPAFFLMGLAALWLAWVVFINLFLPLAMCVIYGPFIIIGRLLRGDPNV